MPRIKLSLPPSYHFSTTLSARISDVNYGGHVGNESMLTLAHEARLQFLQSLGYSELNIEGVSIIMTDAIIQYRSQARWGDQILVELAVTDISSASCDLYYRLVNCATQKEIARIKTGISFFDYPTGKPRPVPEQFRSRLTPFPVAAPITP